jgi:hypothetical protein
LRDLRIDNDLIGSGVAPSSGEVEILMVGVVVEADCSPALGPSELMASMSAP